MGILSDAIKLISETKALAIFALAGMSVATGKVSSNIICYVKF
jgi:hypothetical protein